MGERQKTLLPEDNRNIAETLDYMGERQKTLLPEDNRNIAETLDYMGERQKTLLPEDNRNIAETLYYLGVALGFHKNYDEALMSLESAVSVLTKRMVNLQGKPGTQAKNERTEIKALVPEVKAKIVDMKELKAESAKKAAELYMIGGKAMDSSRKPVTPIPVKKVDSA